MNQSDKEKMDRIFNGKKKSYDIRSTIAAVVLVAMVLYGVVAVIEGFKSPVIEPVIEIENLPPPPQKLENAPIKTHIIFSMKFVCNVTEEPMVCAVYIKNPDQEVQ